MSEILGKSGERTLNQSGFVDKRGREIYIEDVISDGHIIWQVLYREDEGVFLLNCTDGYKHDVNQKYISQFNRIGRFDDLRDLFECD